MPRPADLITIPFSHYCEKARWALDRTRVPYVEKAYLPGIHMMPMRRAGGTSVPLLVTAGRTLKDSADILLHCDELASTASRLYPTDPGARREVEAIEAICNDELGVASRLYAYQHSLPIAGALVSLVRPSLTRVQALLMPFALPLVRGRIRGKYKVNAENAVAALEGMRRVFADIGARLGSKRWLVGDRFTAADLTFASLAAPMVLPPGHPSLAPIAEELPEPVRSAILELRVTPAGRHVQRLYAEERRVRP